VPVLRQQGRFGREIRSWDVTFTFDPTSCFVKRLRSYDVPLEWNVGILVDTATHDEDATIEQRNRNVCLTCMVQRRRAGKRARLGIEHERITANVRSVRRANDVEVSSTHEENLSRSEECRRVLSASIRHRRPRRDLIRGGIEDLGRSEQRLIGGLTSCNEYATVCKKRCCGSLPRGNESWACNELRRVRSNLRRRRRGFRCSRILPHRNHLGCHSGTRTENDREDTLQAHVHRARSVSIDQRWVNSQGKRFSISADCNVAGTPECSRAIVTSRSGSKVVNLNIHRETRSGVVPARNLAMLRLTPVHLPALLLCLLAPSWAFADDANVAPEAAEKVPPAPVKVASPEAPSTAHTTEWYGWQTLLIDAGIVSAGTVASLATQNSVVPVIGVGLYVFAGAPVHAAHGRFGAMFGSVGLRLGIAGLLTLASVPFLMIGTTSQCTSGAYGSGGGGCTYSPGATAIGASLIGVGVITSSILDAALLGHRTVPEATPPSTSALRLSTPAFWADRSSAGLRLAGTF